MDLTSLTSRPALSKITISAKQQDTNQILDEILAITTINGPGATPGKSEFSPNWFSQSRYLGLDENLHRMYSLTWAEHCLFATISLTGLVLLGVLLTWLFS